MSVAHPLELTISGVDYAPDELYEQVPFLVVLERQLPGEDRPDYWLGALREPLRWIVDGAERQVTHLVLAARWEGTQIAPRVERLPVGIAFVTDPTLLADDGLDMSKCVYVAIGVASDASLAESES